MQTLDWQEKIMFSNATTATNSLKNKYIIHMLQSPVLYPRNIIYLF